MKNFVVVQYEDGEGCDYTIGCGLSVEEVKAKDAEGALRAVLGDPCDEDAWHAAKSLRKVDVYEVAACSTGLLGPWKKAAKQAAADAAQAEKEAKERAEFERLRAKFGAP